VHLKEDQKGFDDPSEIYMYRQSLVEFYKFWIFECIHSNLHPPQYLVGFILYACQGYKKDIGVLVILSTRMVFHQAIGLERLCNGEFSWLAVRFDN